MIYMVHSRGLYSGEQVDFIFLLWLFGLKKKKKKTNSLNKKCFVVLIHLF